MLVPWILVIFCCVCLFFLFRSQRPKNFPPGPHPIPIFGNLFHLNISNPLKDFERLTKRYGNVYGLYIGRRPAVVLNGLKAIKEALVTKSADFSGLPENILTSHITEKKEHRRFNLMTLRNFGMGKQSMENRILSETEHILARLGRSVGTTMDPQTLFHDAASNIIHQIVNGSRYDYEDENLKECVQLIFGIARTVGGTWGMIYDTLPFLRNLPLPFKKAFTNIHILKKKVAKMIHNHKETIVAGEPRDFIDCYLEEIEKRVDGSSIAETQLLMLCLDLLLAGTDTTSNTLLTTFLYLITHPDVQMRFQKEIDEVLEGRDHVCFDDRHNMPYTQAVIHEGQCVAITVPLSVIHCTTRDTELVGYSIPKGTLIIPNLSSVLNEEGRWKFPHEFNPSNFLNEQGHFEKPEAFILFSAGPRACLGEGLARMQLFLILVTLLRRFQFHWPEDAGEPDFTLVFGITVKPKPFRMGVRLRQSAREM